MNSTAHRPRRRHPHIIFVELPACPTCGSLSLKAYRSTDQGDGSRMRHTRCVDCGERIHVVYEPPATSGK